jgi:hypothetical protein
MAFDLLVPHRTGCNRLNPTFGKGLSKRVRIAIRIAVRFRAQFIRKQNRDPIIFLSPITMVRFHISAKKIKTNLLDTIRTPLTLDAE